MTYSHLAGVHGLLQGRLGLGDPPKNLVTKSQCLVNALGLHWLFLGVDILQETLNDLHVAFLVKTRVFE